MGVKKNLIHFHTVSLYLEAFNQPRCRISQPTTRETRIDVLMIMDDHGIFRSILMYKNHRNDK
jgi:hypothetical protein